MADRIIGIDLGTTNCALGFVCPEDEPGTWAPPRIFDLPQLIRPADIKARPSLPSFLYIATEGELPAGSMDLPWARERGFMLGEAARERGAEVPSHLVSSSKSWLGHGGVHRQCAAETADYDKPSPWHRSDLQSHASLHIQRQF